MMILRNRFFKSCVFRTKLQEWFRHNGLVGEIEKDSSGMPIYLNGYTEATSYEEKKMVVTYSSLKYIKFFDNPITAIKKWMSTAKDLFGMRPLTNFVYRQDEAPSALPHHLAPFTSTRQPVSALRRIAHRSPPSPCNAWIGCASRPRRT